MNKNKSIIPLFIMTTLSILLLILSIFSLIKIEKMKFKYKENVVFDNLNLRNEEKTEIIKEALENIKVPGRSEIIEKLVVGIVVLKCFAHHLSHKLTDKPFNRASWKCTNTCRIKKENRQ